MADALHQATIAQEGVGVVVYHLKARAVELLCQQLFSQCHAHCVGNALAQRASGGLNAGGDAHFRVTWCFAVQLAKVLQLVHRQVVASEVQQRVNQH